MPPIFTNGIPTSCPSRDPIQTGTSIGKCPSISKHRYFYYIYKHIFIGHPPLNHPPYPRTSTPRHGHGQHRILRKPAARPEESDVFIGGEVPARVEDLTTLAGVGRKTANMVLGNAFGARTIAVDTHVARVSRRLGLAESRNPDTVEHELMDQIPKDKWTAFTNAMILHGREVCRARKQRCCECPLHAACGWSEKPIR